MYHRNRVDIASNFSQPEEKLWVVVRDYANTIQLKPNFSSEPPSNIRRGYKIEKNSVIKFGRVRLRVRDIDYPSAAAPNLKSLEKE